MGEKKECASWYYTVMQRDEKVGRGADDDAISTCCKDEKGGGRKRNSKDKDVPV